jgi:hypothetical protein
VNAHDRQVLDRLTDPTWTLLADAQRLADELCRALLDDDADLDNLWYDAAELRGVLEELRRHLDRRAEQVEQLPLGGVS